ncbi:MAG: aminotransferase class IV [Sandaracinus sp.]
MTSAPSPSPVVIIDGMRVSSEEARVSVFDRGFLFGDAVFEVLRAYGGSAFAKREHLERLTRSLEGMRIVPSFELGSLGEEIDRALAALALPDAYVRVMVSRGAGALHMDPRRASGPTTRVVIAAPLLPLPASLYEGVAIATVRAERPTDHTSARGAKISAYVSNLLALREAQERGAYEAAFLAADGTISEGSSSNLFVLRGRVLSTPPLESGILGGITRAWVIEDARAEGLELRERLLVSRDFEEADEAFLTSSLREVVPIIGIDGAAVGGGRAGAVSRRLHARYRARAERWSTLAGR